MPLSSFQRVYHGVEHGGLRAEVDPARSKEDRHAWVSFLDMGRDVEVGGTERALYEREGRLLVHTPYAWVEPEYRQRGILRALHDEVRPKLVALGVVALTIHAHNIGATIWGRWGYGFDLHGVEGDHEAERIARSVAAIFDPEVPRGEIRRRIPPWPKRLPNAHMALAGVESEGGEAARAARAMRRRIPDEEMIRAGRLGGTFTHPAELVAYEAHGIPVGARVMRWAHWRGILWLDREPD